VRGRRIKTAPEDGEAVYHCVSRTVNGERLFTELEREHLRRLIWLVADYCGVQVLTYAVLSNHFHVLVRVPKKEPIPDHELLRRFERMYPQPTTHQTAKLIVIKAQLEMNGPEADRWRRQQVDLMGDISSYLKLLKQRFSIGFNQRHNRFGTLWAERFKSTMIEPGPALRAVAAYIDLNCVRAGLADDPKEYRFCGYAEAVAGQGQAQLGISWVLGEPWSDAAPEYRVMLFGTGSEPRTTRRVIAQEDFERVAREGGELSLAVRLRCRIRYFTDSGILGSKAFVQSVADQCELKVKHNLPLMCTEGGLELIHGARSPRANS
jgi:putative transposase